MLISLSPTNEPFSKSDNRAIRSRKKSNFGRLRKNVKRFHRHFFWDIIAYLAVIGVIVWLIETGAGHSGYNWQWYRVPRYLWEVKNHRMVAGPLIQGLMVTLQICGVSMGMSVVLGLTAALLRLSDALAARFLARAYVETIRNTPLLVQLLFIYFVLGPVLGVGRFTSATLALSLFEGAYASEIFRAGIVSLPKGQWEAAYSLGLGRFDTYRCVILPQAVRRVLPPLASQAVSLVKDSSLVSVIAVYDLTMQGQAIVSETFLTFEIWFAIAAIYLVITVALSSLVLLLEHRFSVHP